MLRTIGHLKRFTYEYAGCNVGYVPHFSGGIVALLRKYAGHSLVRLDLTANDSSMDYNEPDPTSNTSRTNSSAISRTLRSCKS